MLVKFIEWNSCDLWHQQTSCANMKDSNSRPVEIVMQRSFEPSAVYRFCHPSKVYETFEPSRYFFHCHFTNSSIKGNRVCEREMRTGCTRPIS